jgi:hypothetical protein
VDLLQLRSNLKFPGAIFVPDPKVEFLSRVFVVMAWGFSLVLWVDPPLANFHSLKNDPMEPYLVEWWLVEGNCRKFGF